MGNQVVTTIENASLFGYSPTDGRLSQISNPQIPNQLFAYDYLPNSHLLEKVTGPAHTFTNTYEQNRDVLDLKQNKQNNLAGTVISGYDDAVNAIGQRTGVNTSGTAFPNVPAWLWGYDSLGQVTSADSSVPTSDRGYLYDAIGNRRGIRTGAVGVPTEPDGTTITSNQGTLEYASNNLNQYTAVSVPEGGTGVSPAYDIDGNAEEYPLPVSPTTNSTLIWDAENRLTEVKNGSTTPEKNLFDASSRKIATTVNGVTTVNLYDGWNCIAEYTGTTLSKTRLWGTDLSGSMQGAGGVGGLLLITDHSALITHHYPLYDGNGNVSEYVNYVPDDLQTTAVNEEAFIIAAHFEYDPFGNTVVNTDTTNQFAYRFSTKPLAFATGLYYYGYRYYDPQTGRWPSRDPIEEMGGINLYGFTRNNGVNKIDFRGLDVVGEEIKKDFIYRVLHNNSAFNLIFGPADFEYSYSSSDDYIPKLSLAQSQMDDFYRNWCKEKHSGNSLMETIAVDGTKEHQLTISMMGKDFNSSRFWLGTSGEGTKAISGSFDCCVKDKNIIVNPMNIQVNWIWKDRIDARWDPTWGSAGFSPGENIWYLLEHSLFPFTAFDVAVDFTDKR